MRWTVERTMNGTRPEPGGRRARKLVAVAAAVLGLVAPVGLTAAVVSPTPAGAVTDITPAIVVSSNGNGSLRAFPESATGNVAPSVTLTPVGLGDPYQGIFDASGDLWVTNPGGTVDMFTPSQLVSSGSPTPAVVLTLSSTNGTGLAFDASGDLWVFGNPSNNINEYTPSQIAVSGSPTPVVTIHSSGAVDGGAFDASGDLWISHFVGDTLTEFTPAQLATSSTPTPAVTISSSGAAALSGPWGVAFDASGDLWVGNYGGDNLNEFHPAQLAASGSPTPAETISSSGLSGTSGLSFDASGNLWVAAGSDVVEFTPSQLATGGSPTPADIITGGSTGLNGGYGLTIAQAPTVSSVTPTTGPGAGGTTVTIHGSMFLPGSQVAFGSTAATSVTYVSPYVMTAVAPAGTGTVDTTVTDFAGTSTTSAADQFTYPATNNKYWEVASDGGIFSFGNPYFGSKGGQQLNAPIVGMAPTSDNMGYWEVASDGGIFTFGDALFYGSKGGQHLNAPIVGMAATHDGKGYWEVASDGGVFTFGDAVYYGSKGGQHLNAPIVGMAATADGGGYWLVASDGGVFTFGDALYYGSKGGQHLNQPIVGMAATADGAGYWLVASDGGIFTFGDALFYGSEGGSHLNQPIVGMSSTSDAKGYWEVASDGGIFTFGDALYAGSEGGTHLNQPVVGMGT